jgi:hypothetical protein
VCVCVCTRVCVAWCPTSSVPSQKSTPCCLVVAAAPSVLHHHWGRSRDSTQIPRLWLERPPAPTPQRCYRPVVCHVPGCSSGGERGAAERQLQRYAAVSTACSASLPLRWAVGGVQRRRPPSARGPCTGWRLLPCSAPLLLSVLWCVQFQPHVACPPTAVPVSWPAWQPGRDLLLLAQGRLLPAAGAGLYSPPACLPAAMPCCLDAAKHGATSRGHHKVSVARMLARWRRQVAIRLTASCMCVCCYYPTHQPHPPAVLGGAVRI